MGTERTYSKSAEDIDIGKDDKPICDYDCLNCVYSDCINDSEATLSEREFIDEEDKNIIYLSKEQLEPTLGMTKYIHNRPDKVAYERERNRTYELKRSCDSERKEKARLRYHNNRESRLLRAKSYYENNKDEILAKRRLMYQSTPQDERQLKSRNYYNKNKDTILSRNRRWIKDHIDTYKEYQRDYHSRPEYLEKRREDYQKNKDKISERNRVYREKNREEINRKKREAYHRKKLLESQNSSSIA